MTYKIKNISVPSETIPVIAESDICVVGGSCTGLFAALRAARLGAKVVIIEKQNRFGGVATNSLVNMWHSVYDSDYKEQIIGGLTFEVMERLSKRNAIAPFVNSKQYMVPLNSEELTIELDELALEAKIQIQFHTYFSSAIVDENKCVSAIIVQNKSGRVAIKAKIFVDASGDADLCRSVGLSTYLPDHIQPPTTCAKFSPWSFPAGGTDPYELIMEHAKEYKLPEGILWGTFVPNTDIYMLNGTRVTHKNPAIAEDLTYCEIEGRRQIRAITDIFRKHLKTKSPQLLALPSYIGIRETWHINSLYQVKGEDLLHGKKFEDAIANGTYPVDIHHQEKPGITFKRLDGRQIYCRPGKANVESRWREENSDSPKYYQIPLRSLIPRNSVNVISAGRMLDADKEAFGGIRVMVNLNQTGEAAGVVAYQSLSSGTKIPQLDPQKIRKVLADGGSCIK
jgi:hypothetical protein